MKGCWKRTNNVPGPELTAVGVAGELQLKAGSGSGRRRAWLMGEKNSDARLGWCAGEGPLRIAALCRD